MQLRRLLEPIGKLFQARTRRAWVCEARAHIEYRDIGGQEFDRFANRISELAGMSDAIVWAQVNAYVKRVVFEFSPGTIALSDLVQLVEDAEKDAQVEAARFTDAEFEHPSDIEPGIRLLVELFADASATFFGATLRVLPLPAVPFSGNAAAVLALVQNATRLRSGLDARLGPKRTDLLLSLSSSFATALAQRPMVSLVDMAHKTVLLREYHARRQVWQRIEPSLYATPGDDRVGGNGALPRPTDLPRGPIEEYADRAWVVALAGFAVSFATTRSMQRAVAAIYGSLPRPARLGRDAFSAELGRLLSSRDVLVAEPAVLRRLDRIDCVVLDGGLVAKQRFVIGDVQVESDEDLLTARERIEALFDTDRPLNVQSQGGWELGPFRRLDASGTEELNNHARQLARSGSLVLGLARNEKLVAIVNVEVVSQTGVEELISAAHSAQMRVVVATDDDSLLQAINADDVITGKEGVQSGIRRLQREGRGVCFVSREESPGLSLSDCGIGLHVEGRPAPFGAHLICRDDLANVRFLIRACISARALSKQSVNIALGAASVAALVSAGGLLPMTGRRVLFVVNSAALIAITNGLRASNVLGRQRLPAPRDPTPWHALDAEGVLARLESSRTGLTRHTARERAVTEPDRPNALRELSEAITEELFNPLAPLLAAGAGLSAAVGSLADAAMVGGVVGVNALVGGFQRFRTERKIRFLARTERRHAFVRREGRVESVDATHLVPGDIVVLGAGDIVPADCRILEASSLEVDASSQTGESLPVRKAAAPSFEVEIADRASMLYEGTAIAAGQATAIVVAVGEETEARRGAAAAKGSRSQGGVEKRLRALMGLTAPIAAAAGVGVVGGGLLRGRRLEDLVGSGVSLAVASVPEGLPLLATAAQLSAAERLSQRRALVRNARSIEALGRVDVICLDKTGTVTQGKIALTAISDGAKEQLVADLAPPMLDVLSAGLRATISRAQDRSGDPTDDALREGADKAAIGADYGCPGWTRISELSLEVGRTYHAVLGKKSEGALLSVKGAPEALLLQCTSVKRAGAVEPLDDTARIDLVREATRLARRGLRVLAVAERPMATDARLAPDQIIDLSFCGFVAFSDPVRPTAASAIDGLRRAGVETVMITGDHPSTAQAIADELDLLRDRLVLTGADLAALTDEQLDRKVGHVAVFARVTPSQKVRVVRALQRAGRVVAMAGDGANDAAAIRLADVGIAVGESSTAAARGAADVVLTDGRIETLVDAIVEGRAMWASVRNAVGILMGGNLGEIGFTLAAGLLDGRPPLHARQLLLVNLFTDVAPAMAIALKPPAPSTFESLANQSPDVALGDALDREIATRAIVTGLGAGAAWAVGRLTASQPKARTIALAALVGTQLGQTLTSGDFSKPVVLTSVASAWMLASVIQTPFVSHFFGCRPLGPIAWTTAIGASVIATRLAPRVGEFLSPAEALHDDATTHESLERDVKPIASIEA